MTNEERVEIRQTLRALGFDRYQFPGDPAGIGVYQEFWRHKDPKKAYNEIVIKWGRKTQWFASYSPLTIKEHPVQYLVVTAEPKAEDNLSNHAWYTLYEHAMEEVNRRSAIIKESQSDGTYEVLLFRLEDVQPRTMLEWYTGDAD